jgi:uncharacterized delta-60 repeat protein
VNELSIFNHAPIVVRQIRRQMSKPKMGTFVWSVLLAGAVLIGSSSPAMAQAGKLDPTFGIQGVFTDSAGEFNNTGTFGTVVAIQSNGKILAGGQIGFSTGVVRLNANGTLDSTFGVGGTVTSILGGNDGQCQVVGLAIQTDGKIIVGISNLNQGFGPLFILARLNVNGSLDTTFGSAGVVETQIGSFGAAASVLALQPDGKILLAGEGAMARYNTNGQLDGSFGSGGIATILLTSPTAIALQPDGKILLAAGGSVVGFSEPPPGVALAQAAGFISRYNTNGSLDTSFGISGEVASVAVAGAIAVQTEGGCFSDCEILIGGTVDSLNSNNGNSIGFGVVRYNSNGSVDTTFGEGGAVTTTFAPTEPAATLFAVAVQANGGIVAAGSAGQFAAAGFVTQADLALARYSSTGAPDTTFGSGGQASTAFGTNQAAIYGLALQNDGKIVVVGTSLKNAQIPGGQTGGIVVARYLAQ